MLDRCSECNGCSHGTRVCIFVCSVILGEFFCKTTPAAYDLDGIIQFQLVAFIGQALCKCAVDGTLIHGQHQHLVI